MKLARLLVLVVAVAQPACGESVALEPGQVNVVDNAFTPRTAMPDAGGMVTWNFVGTNEHNIIFGDGVGNLTTPQASGVHVRDVSSEAPGVYGYQCTIHQGMTGSVVVP